MMEGLLRGTLNVSPRRESKAPVFMLHAGLNLSRRKVDVCLTLGAEIVDAWASPPWPGVIACDTARYGMTVDGYLDYRGSPRGTPPSSTCATPSWLAYAAS
jgi:hypothetical protein